jgi:hypothetical protein
MKEGQGELDHEGISTHVCASPSCFSAGVSSRSLSPPKVRLHGFYIVSTVLIECASSLTKHVIIHRSLEKKVTTYSNFTQVARSLYPSDRRRLTLHHHTHTNYYFKCS